jgi:hypothetical protein
MPEKFGSRILGIMTAPENRSSRPGAVLHSCARELRGTGCRGRQNGHSGGISLEASRPQDADKIDFS